MPVPLSGGGVSVPSWPFGVHEYLYCGAGELRAVNARDEGTVLPKPVEAVVRQAEPHRVRVAGGALYVRTEIHVVGARRCDVSSAFADRRVVVSSRVQLERGGT